MNPFQVRLEKAQAQLAKLEAEQVRFDANAMPGTAVTGGSGVSAARLRQLDRQIERTVYLAAALVKQRATVARLRQSVEMYDQGRINAQGRCIGHSKATGEVVRVDGRPRLFVGVYATGLMFCDRFREQHGDYLELAFISYHSLELRWRVPVGKVPSELRQQIDAQAADLIARRGQTFPVSACGQTVVLGE